MIWDAGRNGQPSCLAELSGHQLTVIKIVFSPDSNRLLTLGRDRIAIVWSLVDEKWTQEEVIGKGKSKVQVWPLNSLLDKNGHTRLIWNGCWQSDSTFYTVGRDRQLIKWGRENETGWTKSGSIIFKEAVTAVDSIGNKIVVGTER